MRRTKLASEPPRALHLRHSRAGDCCAEHSILTAPAWYRRRSASRRRWQGRDRGAPQSTLQAHRPRLALSGSTSCAAAPSRGSQRVRATPRAGFPAVQPIATLSVAPILQVLVDMCSICAVRVKHGIDETTSARMKAVRRRDTAAELALRGELSRRGLRYRVDHAPLRGVRRRADVVFVRARLAVFVDGCFWHGCVRDQRAPRTNRQWWAEKIRANRRRDRETNSLLREAGWTVVRIWEHEEPWTAADRVAWEVLSGARQGISGSSGSRSVRVR